VISVKCRCGAAGEFVAAWPCDERTPASEWLNHHQTCLDAQIEALKADVAARDALVADVVKLIPDMADFLEVVANNALDGPGRDKLREQVAEIRRMVARIEREKTP
jgi:hypothetical protein